MVAAFRILEVGIVAHDGRTGAKLRQRGQQSSGISQYARQPDFFRRQKTRQTKEIGRTDLRNLVINSLALVPLMLCLMITPKVLTVSYLCSAMNRSASMAALQPLPAATTACR